MSNVETEVTHILPEHMLHSQSICNYCNLISLAIDYSSNHPGNFLEIVPLIEELLFSYILTLSAIHLPILHILV